MHNLSVNDSDKLWCWERDIAFPHFVRSLFRSNMLGASSCACFHSTEPPFVTLTYGALGRLPSTKLKPGLNAGLELGAGRGIRTPVGKCQLIYSQPSLAA